MKPFAPVDRSINADANVRELSDAGKLLWHHFLHGPAVTALPGVLVVGRRALAEELRWSVRKVDRAFAELELRSMAEADWEARLVWLPKAAHRRPPSSRRIVERWAALFDAAPECALKERVADRLREILTEVDSALRTNAEKSAKPYDPLLVVFDTYLGFGATRARALSPSPSSSPSRSASTDSPPEPAKPPPEVAHRDVKPANPTLATDLPPSPAPEPTPSAPPAARERLPDPFGESWYADAYADGIAAGLGMGRRAAKPRGAELARLVDAILAAEPDMDLGGRCEWLRAKARAYAEAHQGRSLNGFKFADWINSGCPNPTAPRGVSTVAPPAHAPAPRDPPPPSPEELDARRRESARALEAMKAIGLGGSRSSGIIAAAPRVEPEEEQADAI